MIDTSPSAPGRNAAAPGFTLSDLLSPGAFAHPVTCLEVRETNTSWVVLTGKFAYKIKKSVQFDFIDASTLERRRHLCEEELRLNRRLAADLYLDVVAIVRDAAGVHIGGGGGIVEYAVRMMQFEASQELSALLEGDTVGRRELVDLALRLAEFHETAPRASCGPDFSHTVDLHDAVLGNLARLLSNLDAETASPELAFLIDWTHDYLHGSLAQLCAREQSGAIRECHGDLHARNVVRWHGRLVPFDCLEFDPKLRWIDVINDVAFLTMDLTAHGRKDLAYWFLNAYLERTGDYAGVRHLSFYSVYRALVRAMVDGLGALGEPGHRQEFHTRLRARVKAAAAYVERPRPTLFIMEGVSGSGKSWLSERLAPQLGAVRMRSDVERRRLAGTDVRIASAGGYEEGLYTPEMSHRTYARLLDCAESCLKGGVDTLVDAAFLHEADRRLFRGLAAREGFGFIILACKSDLATLTRRVEQRTQLGIDPSDAGTAVLGRQLQDRETLSMEEQALAITIDTTSPQAGQQALTAIQNRLASMGMSLPAA